MYVCDCTEIKILNSNCSSSTRSSVGQPSVRLLSINVSDGWVGMSESMDVQFFRCNHWTIAYKCLAVALKVTAFISKRFIRQIGLAFGVWERLEYCTCVFV